MRACCGILLHPCFLSTMWKASLRSWRGCYGQENTVEKIWFFFFIKMSKVTITPMFTSTITVQSFENTAAVLTETSHIPFDLFKHWLKWYWHIFWHWYTFITITHTLIKNKWKEPEKKSDLDVLIYFLGCVLGFLVR